jgi:predicted transcriptional regulator
MEYLRFKGMSFFKKIKTEEQARSLAWGTRFNGKEFVCPVCNHDQYWNYDCEPEIRKCRGCSKHVRLRKGTMFENSKVPMLIWLRAIYFVMSSKRGISALELQQRLEIGSYRTALGLLKKIRHALMQRDEQYQLSDFIELDGTSFGRAKNLNQREVMVAIETKSWVDKKGNKKEKAGFAKVIVANETRDNAEKFVSKNIKPHSQINTDASLALKYAKVKDIDFDYREMDSKQDKINDWLPWVHRFISNAKSWVVGTHHGVRAQYLDLYLAEYTYRFNRRHDPDSLFHRAIYAMSQADPKTLGSLCA